MQNYQVVDIQKWLRGYCCAEATTTTTDDKAGAAIEKEVIPRETCTKTIGRRRSSILPLIDLRSIHDFNARHLRPNHARTTAAATSAACHKEVVENDDDDVDGDSIITVVNLPASSLLSGERTCELPPRNLDFAILIPREYADTFLNECRGGQKCGGDVKEKKQCPIHKLFFATHSDATMQSRKPWRVRQVLIDTDESWKEAENIQGLVVARCGSTSREEGGENWSKSRFQCLPRLWRPDPLISSYVLPYLKKWTVNYRNEYDVKDDGNADDNYTSWEKIGIVLDLGSGSGRDVCYLAEEIKEFRARCTRTTSRALHFIGVDNHKGSAARCSPLWKNRGVEDITESICLDLNKLNLVRDYLVNPTQMLHLPWPKAACHADIVCIYSIRYLNRKLLSYIANARTIDDQAVVASGSEMSDLTISETHSPPPLQLVLPLGTVIAISHFCKPREGASWKFDHPKESSVLDRWELKDLFTGLSVAHCEHGEDQRWEILYDDLIVDGDHGRTLIQFVAKKIA